MFRTLTIAFLLIAFPLFGSTAKALMTLHPLKSPNGDFKIVIAVGTIDATSFAIFYKGDLIMKSTALALLPADDFPIPTELISREWMDKRLASTDERPIPNRHGGVRGPFPGSRQVRELGKAHYNESVVEYIGLMRIVFRAYDGGIAYRYEIATKKGETITITNELTEFIFPDDYPCVGEVWIEPRIILFHRIRLGSSGSVGRRTTSLSMSGAQGMLRIMIPEGLDFQFGELPKEGFGRTIFQQGRTLPGTFSNLFDSHGNIDRTGTRIAIAPRFDSDIVIQGTGEVVALPWRTLFVSAPSTDGEAVLLDLMGE